MWPALIQGGASLLGSIFSADTNAKNTQDQLMMQQAMQQQSEQFNASQTYQQDQFQQYNSNTAYQRATADMKNAGLNPMMMFGSGGPASTPSGASASVGVPNVPMPSRTSPFAGLGEAVKSGLNAAVTAKEVDKVAEQTANVKLQNDELQRILDAGGPEAKVALDKQLRNIRIPDETRGTGYTWLPDWLKTADVYTGPVKNVADAVEHSGDAFWSVLPGGKGIRALLPGSSAKNTPAVKGADPATVSSATTNRRFYEMGLRERDRRSSMQNAPAASFADRFE